MQGALSRGLLVPETTQVQVDGGWVLNGRKRWIGNATFAEVICIWARNLDTKQVWLIRQQLTEHHVVFWISLKQQLRPVGH